VNAALALGSLVEDLDVDAAILLGVGGALAPGLDIGDVVVSSRVLQHDSYSSLDGGDVRMIPGDLILRYETLQGYESSVPADPALLRWIESRLPGGSYRLGTLLSGNEFVGTTARKSTIAALHPEALLVDMEGAGVAQLCRRVGLPFVVIKTVADRLAPDGTIQSDFLKCLEAAAANASGIFSRLLS
jgi:5'-methylthioadenosine/S-adenosylhomocysteine nucleosidase